MKSTSTGAGLRERLGDRVVDVGEHLVGEELAEALDLLVVGSLRRTLGNSRLVGERPEPPLEVLELDDLEPVDDVDVGVGAPGGAAERELERVQPMRCPRCGPRGPGCPRSRSRRGTRPPPRGSRPGDRRAAGSRSPRRTQPPASGRALLGLLDDGHQNSTAAVVALHMTFSASSGSPSWATPARTGVPPATAACRADTTRRRAADMQPVPAAVTAWR